jgi:predicted nucleotidyltransferase
VATSLDTLRRDHLAQLDAELPRIVLALKSLGARLIILFGSYAAGRRDLFTDLDLLVVMDSDLPFVERIVDVSRRIRPRVPTDILVYTPAEFEAIRGRRFFRHALSTGKVLHARA